MAYVCMHARAMLTDGVASELVQAAGGAVLKQEILIDVGDADSFLTQGQLLPEVTSFCRS